MRHSVLKSVLHGLSICSLLLVSSLITAAPKGLPDAEFQAFLKQGKLAPGNLIKDKELIRKLSNPQLNQAVNSFNVSHFSFLYPVKIKGQEIPSILGRKMEEISVMAVWENTLKPIPFQFDEFDNKNHYIYIPGVNKSPVKGTYLEVDPTDELLFMYRDTGEQRFDPKTMKVKAGKLLKELKFTDKKGRIRYAYLVEKNSERSTADYINTITNDKEGKIVSSFYHIEYDPKNFLVFKDVRPYVGTAADQRVIDNLYFEMSANVFSFVKVGMNSDSNVRITILGTKDGPVRSTAFIKITIVLNGTIPIFSMNSEISFYEQGLVMPNRTEVGKGATFVKIFKNPEIIMYLDMNSITNGRVSADSFVDASGKRLYGKVDGKMDEEETQAVSARLPGDWTWIETGLGWDIFMTFTLPMDKLKGMDLEVYYLDDKDATTEFETFPGAGPHIGMKLFGLPDNMQEIETLNMEYAFWFPDTVGEEGPEAFQQEALNPPKVQVLDL